MNFESVQQLSELFKRGKLSELPDEITITGVLYRIRDERTYDITKMIRENCKMYVIYQVSNKGKAMPQFQQANEQGILKEWIIFIWAINSTLSIVPAQVATNTKARAEPQMCNEEELSEGRSIIGDQVEIYFKRFEKKIKAKTDTGANMSSFHADKWKFLPGKNRVEFRSSLLSDNTITVDCLDQVVVNSADGGTEYRPVVAFDIVINGKELSQVQFNLNDRSKMQDPILLGQNILEKGNFLVDPSETQDAVRMEGEEESVDWDTLNEKYKDVIAEAVEEAISNKEAAELYKKLLESNVSFQDIMRHLKTIAYDTLNETQDY